MQTATMPEKAAKAQLQPKKQRGHHYSVYVIELAPEVRHIARFRRSNPDYMLGKLFVYVGMTGLDIDQRFDKHKAGIQSSRYARDMEVELGIALREAGYGVWQA